MGEQLPAHSVRDGGTVRRTARHVAAQNGNRQRIAVALRLDGGQFCGRGDNAILLQQPAGGGAVEQQHRAVDACQQPGKLKGHQPAGHRATAQQHKVLVRIGFDPFANGLLVGGILHLLQVVNQDGVAVGVDGRGEEIRLLCAVETNGVLRQQRRGHCGFAKAAGRAEQEHAVLLPARLEQLQQGGLEDGC